MAKNKRRQAAAQTGEGYQQNEMTVIARNVRKIIKYIGSALVLLFAYLQLKDFQVGPAIETISPDFLRRLMMIAYYWCWIFGATFDTDIQEMAYFTQKGRNKLTFQAFTLMVLFGIVMAALMWAADDDRWFAGMLTFFFLFNIGGFAYVLWFVRPIIKTSEIRYRQGRSYYSLAQLEIVSRFMNGDWQWYRFSAGLLLVIIMNAICFSDTIRNLIAHSTAGLLSVDPVMLAARLPTFMLVIFIVVIEGWIWVQRGKVMVAFDQLEQLSARYRLEPRIAAAEK